MGKDNSFDIVSEVDMQEVDNAVNQVVKEMLQRYDFKGSKCEVKLAKEDGKITILASDRMKLKSLQEMLSTRFVKRGISAKALQFGSEEDATGGSVRQVVTVQQGIPQEKAKNLVKLIKDTKIKVQASIQGESVRVSGKNRDDLQSIIQLVQKSPIDIPLQFTNYR